MNWTLLSLRWIGPVAFYMVASIMISQSWWRTLLILFCVIIGSALRDEGDRIKNLLKGE